MEQTVEQPAVARPIWSAPAYRNYFLFMLVLSYLFNFMDRQLLSILIEPIKKELLLSDWQLGALGGITFALFYVTFGLPIAKLSDRLNRVKIISIALTVWSVATAACGLAQNFVHLLCARIGVAVGESAATPPSYSLIGDLFEPHRRATAIGIYVVGASLGTGCGLLFGGWASEYLGWRWSFAVVGLPGVLLALAIRLTLREPPRGFSEQRSATGEASTVTGVARLLLQRRSFPLMALASGVASFSGYSLALWLPSYFIRSHGFSVAEAGSWLALVNVGSGIAGSYLGGAVADHLGKRDPRWRMLVPGAAMLLAAPLSIVAFTTEWSGLSLIATAVVLTLYHSWGGPVHAAVQGMVGLRMRGVAVSLLLFVVNLVGLGFGPPIIGLVSDLLQTSAGVHSLRYALLLSVPVFLLASVLYVLASLTLKRDLARAPA